MEEQLVNRLRTMLHLIFPDAKDVKSNTQITINCPICKQQGDPDHGHHMYISLGADQKPPMFNCFRRSGHSGLLTLSNIQKLSNYSEYIDTELMNLIQKQNKIYTQFNAYLANQDTKLNLFIPNQKFLRKSKEFYAHKLYYLSDIRLGIPFDDKMLQENKIILSLFDFLEKNRIQEVTQNHYMMNLLDQYFIGFVTSNNTSVIFRNTSTNQNIRYVSYKIYPNAPTGYYILPSECDILQPIELHIAEGAFDILSVCYHLQNNNRKNKIYAAIGSKAYLNLIKYFMTSIGLIDVVIHLYIDSTIEKNILDEISYYMNPLEIPVYVHINTYPGEKDYGVKKDHISDYYYKL